MAVSVSHPAPAPQNDIRQPQSVVMHGRIASATNTNETRNLVLQTGCERRYETAGNGSRLRFIDRRAGFDRFMAPDRSTAPM